VPVCFSLALVTHAIHFLLSDVIQTVLWPLLCRHRQIDVSANARQFTLNDLTPNFMKITFDTISKLSALVL